MSILSSYLAREGLTQREFATRIGVDQSIVSRLLKSGQPGGTKPGLPLAIRIERETGGAVPAASWVEMQVDKAG
ncbi:helix-turn-helix transcriptional regulator [Paracoccus pantotrophus]